MKVTKAMIKKAERQHWIKEDYPSLVKQHALQSLYHEQKGNKKYAKYYITSNAVRKEIAKLKKMKKAPKRKNKVSENLLAYTKRGIRQAKRYNPSLKKLRF